MSTSPPTQHPDQQPAQQPAQQAPVSVLAVVGLVLALVFAPAGVVLSVMGLRETRDGARSGRGLAVAGVVVGSVITVLAIVAAVLLVVFAATVAPVVARSVTASAPPLPTAPSLPSASSSASASASASAGDPATGPQMTDDITIVDCSADLASSSFSGVLSITNSADVPASYAIRFNGYTEDRQLTAWATGEVTDLAPGATTEVTVTGATFDTTTPVSICRLEGTFRSTDTAG